MDHSTGACEIATDTRAICGARRRTAGSGTPTVTVSFTGPEAPATDTGSVIASVRRLNALTGPITSTVDGSAVTVPTAYPSAGSPSTAGTIGTTFADDGS